ncbi:MAG: biotin transporter BioY [Selenomonadaceae bacterium]|nr:biotin transporter BioY [Selenomonadaceae bacterium]
MQIRELTKMAMCVALCCVAGDIVFPLPFTPTMVTALTIVLSLTAYILPPRQTFTVIALYLLLGAAGLPVFAGTGGISRLVSPVGGFYFAWLIAFPLLSFFCRNQINFKRYLALNILIAIPVTYAGGLISMMALMDISLWQAATMAIFPFIFGDVLKAAAAAFLAVRLNSAQALR